VLAVASIRIALLAILMKPLLRYSIVVDCHYAGIIPSSIIPGFLHFLYSYIHRNADLIIVTNNPHADIVRTSGGRPFILQDRIPNPVFTEHRPESSKNKKVVCICSYNSDEPIDEILNAAELLHNKNITIYMTGDSRGKFSQKEIADNVILTGYLFDEKYWQLLWECDLVVDLTTRENCLLCGAYEAVAVEKPMVLSNSSALRGYFTKGAVFTENIDVNIALSINSALDSLNFLTQQSKELKIELKLNWEPIGEALRGALKELCKPGKKYCTQERSGVLNG
jgi:hypothetical protein